MSYQPVWEGPIEFYAKSQVKLRLYKLQVTNLEYDELVNEAYIAFTKVRDRYTVENIKHFMYLYVRGLSNHFYDLLKFKFKKNIETCYDNEFFKLFDKRDITDHPMLGIMIKEAPKRIQTVIELLFSNSREELKELGIITDVSKNFTNERICKYLKCNPKKINVLKEIKEYFQ